MIVGETENREQIYDGLKRRQLATVATVATVQTAIESLDLPWLDGTLHSAQTLSNRVARQMFPRSMRNIPGKKPPWIIQAVDEKTSFSRRPLVVSDILGQTRFVNGSIIFPKRTGSNGSLSAELSGHERGVEIPEGVGVNVEIIDISSLFKMSILDRAELLGKNLLPLSEVEKFRVEINKFLARVYKGSPFLISQFTNSGLKLYDEATQNAVSFAKIISRTFDISIVDLKAVHGKSFREFLETGKLPQIENADVEKGVQDENFVDPEFAALCAKFKNGEIVDEEKRILAASIREMLEEQREATSNSGFLSHAQIDHPVLSGSFHTLGRLLGINSKSRNGHLWFSADSRGKLLKFVNQYSQGEPFEVAASKGATIFIPGTHPQFGEIRPFLREVFDQAKSQGFDIANSKGLSTLRNISTDRFTGTIQNLVVLLGIREKQQMYVTRSDLRALLEMAGIED